MSASTLPIAPAAVDRSPSVAGRFWAGLALLAVTSTVFLATAATFGPNLDALAANIGSWRIANTATPWIDGVEVPQIDGHEVAEVWIADAPNGHRVVTRSPGVVAAGVPAYWLARGDQMTTTPGNVTAALMAAVAVLLVYIGLLPRLGIGKSITAAMLFGFTTPVWSIAANEMWPHTITIVGILGMAWGANRERWWLVGLFGGVALWGRLHAAIIVAMLGIGLALIRRRPRIAVEVGAISGLFLALESVWSRWMYGSWNPMASYDAGSFASYADDHGIDLANQLGFWVSPDRGILVWSPLLVVLAPAVVKSWRNLPDWARVLLVGGLAYTVVQGLLNRFSGGMGFYGYRLGLEFLACATPALALSAAHMGRRAKLFFTPVAIVQFAMILPGAVVHAYFVGPDEVWTQSAFANVVAAVPAYPLVIAGMIAVGVLGIRVAGNPQLDRPRRGLRSSTTQEPNESV